MLGGCASSGTNKFMASVSDTASSVGSSLSSAASGLLESHKNGVYVSPEQLAKIEVGKSDEQDVVSIIGHPVSKEQLRNKELWKYPYSSIPLFGSNTNETTIIEFNASGIVLAKYKAGGRSDSSGNALIDAANGVQ